MRAAENVSTEQPTWILVIDDLATRAQYQQVGGDSLEDAYHKALDLAVYLRELLEDRQRLQATRVSG